MVGREVIDLGLDRMHAILALLGHPELFPCPVVHITGTNGKGSVAEMVACGLVGKSVGVFTSPFLVKETDAIRLFKQGSPKCISEESMKHIQTRICGIASENKVSLTDFEVLVATALVYFEAASLDAVVIEVGMGGARDATNVFKRSIAVVTSIGLDHQQFLGNTVEQICAEKCGIFAGTAIVNGDITCMHVVSEMAHDNELVIVSTDSVYACPFNGSHQPRLMQIAIEVIKRVDPHNFEISTTVAGIQTAVLPGRLQHRADLDLFPLLLDGAHNIDSAKALRHFVGEETRNVIWILATSKGREEAILPVLLTATDTCICIEFKADGAVSWVQTASAPNLAQLAKAFTPNVLVLPGLQEALAYVQTKMCKDQLVVVTGSLYLVRDYLRLLEH